MAAPSLAECIALDNPAAAGDLVNAVLDNVEGPNAFPQLSIPAKVERPGRIPGRSDRVDRLEEMASRSSIMITVYGFGKVTPEVIGITRDLRVLWALEECDLAYQVRGLDDFAGELQGSGYAELNPFGKVPAIDHDGFVIFESGAILVYLAEQSGRLMPTGEAERAKALQWAFAALDTVETPLTEIAVIDLFEADAEWAKLRRPALVEIARGRLEVLERTLIGKTYLLGDRFSYPDILMATSLHQIQHTDILKTFPNATSYLARCEDRPAWRRCLDTYKERLAG